MDALTKRTEKMLDDNHALMLRAVLNKSWNQHSTKQQLYSHLLPISTTIQDTRNTVGKARKNWKITFSYGHMDAPMLIRQQKLTCISPVQTLDLLWRTCWQWCMIGMDGEIESEKSVLTTRWWWRYIHTRYIYIYIYIYVCVCVCICAAFLDKCIFH